MAYSGLAPWTCWGHRSRLLHVEKVCTLGVKDVDQVASVQRRIVLRALLIAGILAVLAVLFGRWSMAWGVLAGCVFAIINFRLMYLGIVKILDQSTPRAAQVQAVVRYLIRYLILIGFLYMVSINPNLNFYAAAVGLLLIKVVILGEAIYTYIKQQVQRVFHPARWERGGK